MLTIRNPDADGTPAYHGFVLSLFTSRGLPKTNFWIEADFVRGPAFSNAVIAVGPIESGTMKSVPGYGPEPFEGEFVNGADIFQVDALFRSVKLDFRAVIK